MVMKKSLVLVLFLVCQNDCLSLLILYKEFRAAVAHKQHDDNSKTAQKSKIPSMEGIERPSRDAISRANKTIRSMDLPVEERQETLYRKSSQSLNEDKDLETKSPELEVDSPLDLESERFGGDTEVDSAWVLDEAELVIRLFS